MCGYDAFKENFNETVVCGRCANIFRIIYEVTAHGGSGTIGLLLLCAYLAKISDVSNVLASVLWDFILVDE